MMPRKMPEKTQMNLLFCDSKPMMLPDDKQWELTIAWNRLQSTVQNPKSVSQPGQNGMSRPRGPNRTCCPCFEIR